MADYTTQPVVLRGPLVGNILRTEAPPAGAVAMGLDLPGIGLVIVNLEDLSAASGSGPSATIIAQTVSLDVLQALPTTNDVVENVQYTNSDDRWNNGDGGTVQVLGLASDAYWPVGIGLVNGSPQLVSIDVDAATYVPFAGGAAGPFFDPYDVSLAIRQAVADGFATQDAANNDSPFLSDPQPAGSLVGMKFLDPDTNYSYAFEPVAFANGTFNVWSSYLLSR